MRPGPKPHSLYLYDVFLLVSKERGLHKLLLCFGQYSRSYQVTKF